LLCCAALIGSNACGSSASDDDDTPPAQMPVAGSSGGPASSGGAPAMTSGSGGTPAAVATGGTTAPATGGTTGSSGASGSGGTTEGGGSGGMTAPPTGSPDWAFIGYDVGSSYFNSAETKLTKATAANLKEVWTADMGGPVMGAPLQIGGVIYASGPSTVKAFDAATGDMKWSVNQGSSASLAYADGMLYSHINSGAVAAIKAEDGSPVWSKDPNPTEPNDGSSSPIIVGDTLLIGGANGTAELTGGGTFRGFLAAMNRMTGDSLWVTYTVPQGSKGASTWSSPSADPEAGFAYGGTGNNYGSPATDSSDSIIQFDLKSGEIKWKAQRVEGDAFGLAGGGPDADFGANPVLYETMVDGKLTQIASAGNKGGDAHAVRRDTGELLWTRDFGAGAADGSQGVFVNSAWSGKNMLFACNTTGGATLYGLDGATGDIAWMRDLPGQVWGRMSAVPGVGFVGTGGELQVFDTETGEMIKSFPSKGGTIASTVTVSNGRVAFGEGFSWSSGRPGSTLHVLSVE
jgi:polyvinyl alcohol dehydrogenase (cytochrome)